RDCLAGGLSCNLWGRGEGEPENCALTTWPSARGCSVQCTVAGLDQGGLRVRTGINSVKAHESADRAVRRDTAKSAQAAESALVCSAIKVPVVSLDDPRGRH